MSWECAANLRQSVIDEYERGDEVTVEDEVESSFGKKVHTATVLAQPQGSSAKKAYVSNFEAGTDIGYKCIIILSV